MDRKLLVAVLFSAVALAIAGCGGGGGGYGGSSSSSGDSGPYDLTFSGTAFDVHNGQDLNFVLTRVSDGVQVSDGTLVVASGAFAITMSNVLASGVSYNLYYYADMNGNGTCDAPPTDHVWSNLILSPMANVTLNIVHNANFDAGACAYF